MKFSYNWLQSFFIEKLSEPEKLAELLTSHSFEVEEVNKKGEDYILEIDILPNRAHDCLSHYGLAREIAAVAGLKISFGSYEKDLSGHPANWRGGQNKSSVGVEIQNNSLCERYSAYVIEGIHIKASPSWIRERLAAMNQKAINNVVDITNYIMWEFGQPLHAFDLDKIRGVKMNVRLSKQGEKLETLDGLTYDLGDDAITIEDAERLIDLAGIKGGNNTQIDNNTSQIIFQAAIFDPVRIRRTTQKLGVKTEAAVRYIHGFDPNLPPQALERAVELLGETNPEARIVQKIDMYPCLAEPKKIILDINYANKFLGTYLSVREVKQILERLGFQIQRGAFQVSSFKFQVTIPTYRLDINIQEDIIEEIARMYGYEKIAHEPPRGMLVSPRRNEQVFWRAKTREILVGFGFFESYNYSLISGFEFHGNFERKVLQLANPVSDEFRYLRPTLVPRIIKNLAENSRFFESEKIFELGRVFYGEKEKVREGENLILAVSSKGEAGDFYVLKGYIDELLKKLGVSDFYFDPAFSNEDEGTHGFFLHAARRANIMANNKFLGFIGEVSPKMREQYDTKQRVYCAELDFDQLMNAAEEEHVYAPASKYPEVVRDIALLVPRDTMVEEVLHTIELVGGRILRDTDLFDMYEGENLPEGMKNLAFHLLFQSDERTLTSKEVDEIMEKITKILEDNSWEVR